MNEEEIEKAIEEKFGMTEEEIEVALDEAEREAQDPNTKYYTQEELDLMVTKIFISDSKAL